MFLLPSGLRRDRHRRTHRRSLAFASAAGLNCKQSDALRPIHTALEAVLRWLFRRPRPRLGSDLVAHLLPPATMHLQTFGRPVQISSAPSPLLQPSQRAVLHQGASSYGASAAPADELTAVERIDNLVDLIRFKHLVVMSVYFEDLFVMAA